MGYSKRVGLSLVTEQQQLVILSSLSGLGPYLNCLPVKVAYFGEADSEPLQYLTLFLYI